MKAKNIFMAMVAVTASLAASSAENRTLFVHHKSGIEPILYAEIDSIRFSCIGIDSIECSVPVVQEIWTIDSVYRYNIADVLSTSFEAPATVARENAINLEEELAQYIEGIETDEWGDTKLILSSSTPVDLIPQAGQYIYQFNSSDKLPNGLACMVGYVNGTEISCYEAEISDIFDTLVFDSQTSFDAETTTRSLEYYSDGVSIEPGWIAAENTYPYGPFIVDKMTEELRDIPVGPEQLRVTSKIRVRPRVNMWAGIYVLGGKRNADGSWAEYPVETHKIVATCHTPVEAHVDGRASTDEEHTIGKDKKWQHSVPFGLGRSLIVTFSGIMKIKGKMGLDYDYTAEYYAKTAAKTFINDYTAAMKGSFKNSVVNLPKHQLDASMEGTLSLSASITATLSHPTDPLKSLSSSFIYGTMLNGKALYLTSQLDEAETDNSLYRRITNLGVKAIPIETAVATSRYESKTLTIKSKEKSTGSTTFYAVPVFKAPSYNNGEITFKIEGAAMRNCESKLGIALFSNGQLQKRLTTSAVWPGASKLIGNISTDFETGNIIYPTATLCDKTILGSPAYPDNSKALSPVAWVCNSTGVRIISGMPIVSKASNGKTCVYVGNIITLPTPE